MINLAFKLFSSSGIMAEWMMFHSSHSACFRRKCLQKPFLYCCSPSFFFVQAYVVTWAGSHLPPPSTSSIHIPPPSPSIYPGWSLRGKIFFFGMDHPAFNVRTGHSFKGCSNPLFLRNVLGWSCSGRAIHVLCHFNYPFWSNRSQVFTCIYISAMNLWDWPLLVSKVL